MLEVIGNFFGVSREMLMMILPILFLHLLLIVISCIALYRNYKNKLDFLWIIVIFCITIFGPVLYLSIGKNLGRDN